MTKTWLSNNEEMENVLLSNGICRHLGWDQISQVAEWAVVTHKQAQVLLQAQITKVQEYIERQEQKPATRRPMTRIHGIPLDEAIKRAADPINWQTAGADMAHEHWSLEFAKEVRALLESKIEDPELPLPHGIQDESLWMASGPNSVLLVAMPHRVETAISTEVHDTGSIRTFPFEMSGVSPDRVNFPPDSHPVERITRILPQHRAWILRNLSGGAALLGDLVSPVGTAPKMGK